MSAPSLRARLLAGDQLVGALVRVPGEDLVEMLAVAGLDVVVVDAEHGPADATALRHHVMAAQVHGVPVLVRTGADEPALVLRALDQGAVGVIAPHVEDAVQAAALVASAHYPPLGQRGFATYPRAGRFGTVPPGEHLARAARETLVIAMIESPAAAGRVAEVVAVPGVDGYLIGPADLAAARTDADPPLAELVAAVHRDAAGEGVLRVDIVNDVDACRAALDAGASLVLYNTAHLLMGVFAAMRPLPPG